MKKIFKKTLGVICIIIGFVALITPFSPGSWLLLIGLEILGLRILLERRLLPLFLKDKHIKKLHSLVSRVMPRAGRSRRAESSPPDRHDAEQKQQMTLED